MKLSIVDIFKNPIIIRISLLKKCRYSGITLYPFVIIAQESILKHELVHVEQIKENGFTKFYCMYLFYFVKNLIKYKNWHKAYFEIPFEKEAYEKTR